LFRHIPFFPHKKTDFSGVLFQRFVRKVPGYGSWPG